MSFLSEGKKKEAEFSELLLQKYGGEIVPTSTSDDIDKHIDVAWIPPEGKRKCLFDVKGKRKNSRSDNIASEENTWVEFRSVRGNIGSLLGKEDYIAFETDTSWIIVRREDFANKCFSKIKENKIYTENPNENFLLYSREGRNDIIMRIPISLAAEMACMVIDK